MNKIKSKPFSKPPLVKRGLGEFVFLFFAFVFLLLQPFFIQAQSYVAVTTGPWYDPALYPDDPENPDSKLNCGNQVKPFPVDWDDDGDMDILVGNSDGTICYFANNGDDTFEKFENFGGLSGVGSAPYAVQWHEDADVDYDLIFATGDIDYCENTGSTGIVGGNTFSCTTSYIVASAGGQPTLVDWNEDGFYDIIAGTSDGNLVYISNNGANVFSETDAQWQGIDFGGDASPNVVDFNGDGFLDVVVGEGSSAINLIINSGDNATFTVTENFIPAIGGSVGDSPRFLDWDSDGHLDFITGASNGYIALYLNDYDSDTYVGSDDCNNEDAAINIAAEEVCDSIDNDCDGEVDEDNTADGTTYYLDADTDGFGDSTTSIITCDTEAPDGYVTSNTDCNDNDATASTLTTFYYDADEDDFGDESITTEACAGSLTGFVSNATDCDDSDATLTTDCPAAGDDDTTGDDDDDDDDTATASGGCGLQGGRQTPPAAYVSVVLIGLFLLVRIRKIKLY